MFEKIQNKSTIKPQEPPETNKFGFIKDYGMPGHSLNKQINTKRKKSITYLITVLQLCNFNVYLDRLI